MIKIVIPGTPVPQSRPRFTRQGHAYESGKSRDYKKVVAMAAEAIMGAQEPLRGALWCNVIFYMPIPKSTSQKRRKELMGAFVVKKPDTDNLVKAVTDGMNGIVYVDDSQIVRIIAEKKYDENPRAEILIDEV